PPTLRDTLSLHDALPISSPPALNPSRTTRPHSHSCRPEVRKKAQNRKDAKPPSGHPPTAASPPPCVRDRRPQGEDPRKRGLQRQDRKSTRLNSSHVKISY